MNSFDEGATKRVSVANSERIGTALCVHGNSAKENPVRIVATGTGFFYVCR